MPAQDAASRGHAAREPSVRAAVWTRVAPLWHGSGAPAPWGSPALTIRRALSVHLPAATHSTELCGTNLDVETVAGRPRLWRDHGRTSGPVPYRKLVREVSRFAPEALLPALAREGATQTFRHRDDPRELLNGGDWRTPWAVAGLARESLIHGVNRGQREPTDQDVLRLCGLFANLDDPLTSQPGGLECFLVRTLHEQFRCQLSEFEELARPNAARSG